MWCVVATAVEISVTTAIIRIATTPERVVVRLSAGGRDVEVVGSQLPPVEIANGSGGRMPYAFVFKGRFWPSDHIGAWIRHLVRQAVGGACTTALVSPEWKHVRILAPVPAEKATELLAGIVAFATRKTVVDPAMAGGGEEPPEELAPLLDPGPFLRYKGQKSKNGGK